MLQRHLTRRASTHLKSLFDSIHNAKNDMRSVRILRCHRSFATSRAICRQSTSPATPTHNGALRADLDIYVSASTDPYFNLTLEDWLFRHAPESRPLLLVYRDSPCVIIGRNQNPWTEVNFAALQTAGIPFIRRRSGGGTVFHDLGNTNFSIHLPRTEFDRHATGNLVLRAVKSMGIEARLNDRNDVCVGPDKMSVHSGISTRLLQSIIGALLELFMDRDTYLPCVPLHVSGSAYKIVNKRAYHHGTMLISTRLQTLGDVLRPQENNIITKGVSSVRSPVCNLQRHDSAASHDRFVAAVISQFRQEFGVSSDVCIVTDDNNVKGVKYIQDGMAELSSWDWAYGQTPEFTRTLTHEFPWGTVDVEIRSKHGLIICSNFDVQGSHIASAALEILIHKFSHSLQGKRYGFLEDERFVNNADVNEHLPGHILGDLHAWIRRATNIIV